MRLQAEAEARERERSPTPSLEWSIDSDGHWHEHEVDHRYYDSGSERGLDEHFVAGSRYEHWLDD